MSLAAITAEAAKTAQKTSSQTGTAGTSQDFKQVLKNGIGTVKTDMDAIFEEAASLYQLPVKLLRAVAKAESGFNPKAVSKAGAMGVMQLMPATARSLGVSDPYDARQNILGGAKYLKQNLERFGGNISLALAAYNAGPGSVTKYGGVPPYKETQNYVKTIMADYTGNNTILANRSVETQKSSSTVKAASQTASSYSLLSQSLSGTSSSSDNLYSSLTSLLGNYSNSGSYSTNGISSLMSAWQEKGEEMTGEEWSNMVQIVRLQMMMNMGKDTGTLI